MDIEVLRTSAGGRGLAFSAVDGAHLLGEHQRPLGAMVRRAPRVSLCSCNILHPRRVQAMLCSIGGGSSVDGLKLQPRLFTDLTALAGLGYLLECIVEHAGRCALRPENVAVFGNLQLSPSMSTTIGRREYSGIRQEAGFPR